MAFVEVQNSVVGSSVDNFLIFQNTSSDRPYVTFYFNNQGNPVGHIIVRDALDDDGFYKEIKYSPSEIISDSSFKTFPGNKEASTFSLLECLKKNQIFFDVTLKSGIPNVGILVMVGIDSSTRYSIVAGDYMTVGGTYSSYVPKLPNKFVVLENTSDGQIALEKYAYGSEVSFNVTSPFEHLTFKDPFKVSLLGYKIDDNNVVPEVINNNLLTVLPTTLSKFQEVNLDNYNYQGGGNKVNFLTNNFERSYNYGEIAALSILSPLPGIIIKKKYYTPSGVYLNFTDQNSLRHDALEGRHDFYFTCDLNACESITNRQVGYVEVIGYYNNQEITNPVRYKVEPKCNSNNVIFFMNEIGGVDSFNFLGEREYSSSIDDQTTYFRNPIRKQVTLKEIEIVGQKKNKIEHTLTTTIIDTRTAKWLNELKKSKYHFLFDARTIQKIIVTDFNIELTDRDNTFELQLTYQDSDNNLSL